MKVTGQDYEDWLRTFYCNENLLYSYLTSKKKQYLNYQINSVGKFMSDQLKDAKRNKGPNFKDDNWQKKQLGILSELQTERDSQEMFDQMIDRVIKGEFNLLTKQEDFYS